MEIKDIESKLRTIVAENLYIDAGEIIPEARLSGDLGADSLDCVEMAIAAEDEFGINLDDESLENVTTFQQAVDLVKSKVDRL